MGAPVVWFEIAGRDLAALDGFYTRLFDWTIDAANPMGYGMVDTGAGRGVPGGVFATEDGPDYVTFYVEVADIEATLASAEGLGAKVLQTRTALPAGPVVAMLADPEGHRVGLIESD